MVQRVIFFSSLCKNAKMNGFRMSFGLQLRGVEVLRTMLPAKSWDRLMVAVWFFNHYNRSNIKVVEMPMLVGNHVACSKKKNVPIVCKKTELKHLIQSHVHIHRLVFAHLSGQLSRTAAIRSRKHAGRQVIYA